jgi:hypothetical protein
MTLHSSQIGGAGGAATAALKSTAEHRKSTATSFSAHLKDASATAGSDAAAKKKGPTGETTKAIDGHKYSDILTGPRKGLYLNTGSNDRAGEAFVMVRKNGREYHIYGTGENRRVIGLPTADEKKNDAVSTTDPTSRVKTSTAPDGTTGAGKISTDASTTS